MDPQVYEEDTIDLLDLFYYLLRKWKTLLVAVLVGLVCGALFFAAKSTVLRYEPEEEDLLKLEQVYQYQMLYEKQLKYNEEAFVTQLDEDADYVTGEISYYIKAGENTVVLGGLFDITNSPDYVATLREQLGWEGAERYIRSIIGYSFSMAKDSTDNITLAETGAINEDKTYGTISYTVRLVNEEDCQALLDYIESWFEEQNAAYQRQYGPYTVEKLSQRISDAGDAGVLSAKSDAINTAAEMQATLKEYFDEFSGDEMDYYNEHYTEDYEPSVVGTVVKAVKWPILLAVVACVLWGIYWVVAYLASGTVRQIDTLTEQYKLPLVGRIENTSGKREKGLDGAIRRWEDGRKPAACTVQYLSSALALLPGRDIVLCQTSGDADSSALVEELKRQSAKPVYSGALHTDAQTLQAGKKAGGIFLLVTLEKTRLEELKAELRACKLHGLQVLGVVVLG